MKKVFIIHGYGGQPNAGWRPWLMSELAKEGIWACALSMPMADKNPQKDEWVKEIARMVENPNEDIFLVGHSLGVPAILNYLNSLPKGIVLGGSILVSGSIGRSENDEYRPLDNFVDISFDFKHIMQVCKNFTVIHGDDDPLVPFKQAEKISQSLSCELISIPNGKHLGDDCHELPEALDSLLKMIKN